MLLLLSLAIFISNFGISLTQFVFPDVILQAHEPKGFTVYINDRNDIQFFAFQGNINRKIPNYALGEISAEVKSAVDGKWIYHDPNLELHKGDEITYWSYVQSNDFGYISQNSWKVSELTVVGGECKSTLTYASSITSPLCAGKLIFEDNFSSNTIDRNLWTVEHYIPTYFEDNFEFVSYQDTDECRFIQESKLYLKPIPVDKVRGTLDLKDKCTRKETTACQYTQQSAYYLPPVKSAKIISKMAFRYGRIEIKAKLPIGNWIYPQVELIPKDMSVKYPKILMAYARGNENLTLNDGEDIGNRLLFGGHVKSSTEPERSRNLKSFRSNIPLGRDSNLFVINWTPDKIEFFLNNSPYGTINLAEGEEFRIALGVGVGGNVDFPNGVRSDLYLKPWENYTPAAVKDFYVKKSEWIGTWRGNDVCLQVDYIKVFAL